MDAFENPDHGAGVFSGAPIRTENPSHVTAVQGSPEPAAFGDLRRRRFNQSNRSANAPTLVGTGGGSYAPGGGASGAGTVDPAFGGAGTGGGTVAASFVSSPGAPGVSPAAAAAAGAAVVGSFSGVGPGGSTVNPFAFGPGISEGPPQIQPLGGPGGNVHPYE